jgi:hypothetical protein
MYPTSPTWYVVRAWALFSLVGPAIRVWLSIASFAIVCHDDDLG